MILEAIASYFALPDSIQVAIVVQEDDGASAAAKVKTGIVEILHGTTAMVTENFINRHVTMLIDQDGVVHDRGQFYFFFHHPPVQRNMNARISVVMSDGRTATQTVGIDSRSADAVQSEVWQNPALAGRPVINYDLDDSFPARD